MTSYKVITIAKREANIPKKGLNKKLIKIIPKKTKGGSNQQGKHTIALPAQKQPKVKSTKTAVAIRRRMLPVMAVPLPS